MTSKSEMKLLYFDTWRVTPDPIPYPGCLTVQVLGASTPGGQDGIKCKGKRFEVFRNILKHRRRSLKRSLRYFQAIGGLRTFAKIRSNVLAYQSQLGQTLATIAGVVIEAANNDAAYLGSKVAGYRSSHPLYADLILVHPDQVTEIPERVPLEDAATVFYYALALEAMNRLKNITPSALPVICGDTLPCFLLRQLLADMGQETLWFHNPNHKCTSQVESLVSKNAQIVVGSQKWYEHLSKDLFTEQVHFMGLNADSLQVAEWNELKGNWIGLPHPDVCNINIFSRLSLELPRYLNSQGIREAILDMAKRQWSPSAFLTRYDVKDAQEKDRISLDRSYFITGLGDVKSNRNMLIYRKVGPIANNGSLKVGFIGLGMWARGNLIPFLLRDSRVRVVAGADQDAIHLHQAGDLFKIPILSSDPRQVISSDQVDAVFISTWHDSHANLASLAVRSGKKVFVEKPLALDYSQLAALRSALQEVKDSFLAVGYNRFHSPLTKLLREELLNDHGPVTLTAAVREPAIPRTHYYYWPQQGPRVVSNGCHWIDYAFHLLLPRIPSDIRVISALGQAGGDNNGIIIRYEDGSLVTLSFTDRGESLVGGNEYIDIKFGDCQYMIQDFTTCTCYREGKVRKVWKSQADRGWEHEMRDIVDSMILGAPPRDYHEILQSASLVLEAMYSQRNRGEARCIPSEWIGRP